MEDGTTSRTTADGLEITSQEFKVGHVFVVGDTHGSKIEFKSEPEDLLIHVGDWERGEINTAAKKVLIRGNHDMFPTDGWDFVCDGLLLDHVWYTHEPAFTMPLGAHWNVCGHVHDNPMNEIGYLEKPWHIVVVPNEIRHLEQLIMAKKEKNERRSSS